jgi:hypothetical protein
MLSSVLGSERAITINIEIMRAFVKAARYSASSSVPRGTSGGGIPASGRESGIDVWQSYDPEASGHNPLNPNQEHVPFSPQPDP